MNKEFDQLQGGGGEGLSYNKLGLQYCRLKLQLQLHLKEFCAGKN